MTQASTSTTTTTTTTTVDVAKTLTFTNASVTGAIDNQLVVQAIAS